MFFWPKKAKFLDKTRWFEVKTTFLWLEKITFGQSADRRQGKCLSDQNSMPFWPRHSLSSDFGVRWGDPPCGGGGRKPKLFLKSEIPVALSMKAPNLKSDHKKKCFRLSYSQKFKNRRVFQRFSMGRALIDTFSFLPCFLHGLICWNALRARIRTVFWISMKVKIALRGHFGMLPFPGRRSHGKGALPMAPFP